MDDLLSNIRDDGSLPISIMIPKAFGGSGEADQDWIICDSPVILYTLAKMIGCDPALNPAWEKLQALAGEHYYPCCGSIPKFKGPGPRSGMCPYANLLADGGEHLHGVQARRMEQQEGSQPAADGAGT